MAGGRKIKCVTSDPRYGYQVSIQLYPGGCRYFWDVPLPPAAADHSVSAGDGEQDDRYVRTRNG